MQGQFNLSYNENGKETIFQELMAENVLEPMLYFNAKIKSSLTNSKQYKKKSTLTIKLKLQTNQRKTFKKLPEEYRLPSKEEQLD